VSEGRGRDSLHVAGLGEEELSQLAHFLKNPLSAILGYSELLLQRDDPAILREAPRRIHEAASGLADVVDDLVTVLGVDAGVLRVVSEPLELGAAVAAAVEALGGLEGRAPPQVDGGRWPVVRADAYHLPRILGRLLRATGRLGGPGVSPRLSVDVAEAYAALSIVVAGVRLTRAQRQTLFDPFATFVLSSGEPWSGGLQLYAVRRLVELHGGAVAAPDVDGGVALRLTLPLAVPP
jgi:signal transduction histidine kinase